MKKSKWFEFHGKRFSSKRESETLREAFEKSLEKWRLIIDGFDPHGDDIETCGLCDLYYEENCVGCPIYNITNDVYCERTPFEKWSKNPSTKNAKMELDFLKVIKKYSMK